MQYHRPDLSVRPTFEDDDYEEPMIEQLECPNCHGNKWYIWGEPFESGGNLVVLSGECAAGCGVRLNIGTVDSQEMVARIVPKAEEKGKDKK
jgi:hypothetical protein